MKDPPPYKPEGWPLADWVAHLRQLAERCRWVNPEQARIYEKWAEQIESRDYGQQQPSQQRAVASSPSRMPSTSKSPKKPSTSKSIPTLW